MSYARLILSAAAKEALPTGLHKALPAKYAATPLIQHFLNNVFVLVPVFEESALYASVDAIYQQGDVATPWDKWIVRMVLAIACLSQSEQRGDTHYSDAVGHVNAALENAEDVLHPGYVTSIQALVLFTIYAAMDPHHFDSWTLIGAASRAMIDLGIHQDPSRNVIVSKGKLEIRRRVYWCVYAIDRYVILSSATLAPLTLLEIYVLSANQVLLILRRSNKCGIPIPQLFHVTKVQLTANHSLPAEL